MIKSSLFFIDARNYYTAVDRTLNEWSEWQMKNLNAIVWLYRGKIDKYTCLLEEYHRKIKTNTDYLVNGYTEIFKNKDPVYQRVHDAISAFTTRVKQAKKLTDYFDIRPLIENIYIEWKAAVNVIVDDVTIFERINQYFLLKKKDTVIAKNSKNQCFHKLTKANQ